MRRGTWGLLALALGSTSCSRAPRPAAKTAPVASATTTALPSTPPVAPQGKAAEYCRLLKENDYIVVPRPFNACWGTPGGAWALLLDPVTETDDGVVGTWTLVHVDRAAYEVRLRPVDAATYTGECPDPSCAVETSETRLGGRDEDATFSVLPFDWDDDGEPELYVEVAFRSPTTDKVRGRIWTFKDGAIGVHAPTAALDVRLVQDFDLDGRPDLFVHVADGSASCRKRRWGDEENSLDVLVHALPKGDFSTTDVVARSYLDKRCRDRE